LDKRLFFCRWDNICDTSVFGYIDPIRLTELRFGAYLMMYLLVPCAKAECSAED